VAAKRSWKSGEKAALFRTRPSFPDEGFSRNLQRREYRSGVEGGAGWKVSAPCWARQLSSGVEWRLCTRSLLVGLRKRGWTHPEAAARSWFHPLISSSSLLSEKAFRQKALSANQLAATRHLT
jgi:hypothetical protein